MALFKSRHVRELEARVRIRQGMARIQRFIRNARRVQKEYWDLGKQALRFADREQFQQLAAALARTQEHASRWERYLLQLKTLSVRREEAAATSDFIRSISAMADSILRGAAPQDVVEMQGRMEQALAKSEALDEVLSLAMEASADRVFGADELDQSDLRRLEEEMSSESAMDQDAPLEKHFSQDLGRIEEAMRKEL